MFCQACHQLLSPVDFATLCEDHDKISRLYEQRDTLPDCFEITASAQAGCQLCAAVVKSIRKRWPLDRDGTRLALRIGPMAHFLAHSLLTSGLSEEENGLYLLELDLQIEGHEYTEPLRFELYANPASNVAARFNIKRVAPMEERANESCAQLLLGWIEDCTTLHEACRQGSYAHLPTRLIDVGIASKMNPSLVLSSGTEGRYAALSHCWGPLVPGSRLLRTTSLNIEDMMNSIPLESMPQNFQDAVTVTRMLGLRYLWIDSLCIIQDSKVDWEREGAMMGDIYKNAYVTIAATLAGKSEDGFLKVGMQGSRTVMQFPDSSLSAGYGELVLQEAKDVGTHWEKTVECTTWNDRGWTMQERYLSRRMIHFSEHQIYWECQSRKFSETGEIIGHAPVAPPPYLRSFSIDDDLTSDEESSAGEEVASTESAPDLSFLQDLYDWWYIIAAQYSSRKLTYASDKLPALSGMAAEMASLTKPFILDCYLCGIWEGDLTQGLLWINYAIQDHKCHPSRAPSWSWAKCDGQVSWRPRYERDEHSPALSRIKIVRTEVQLQGSNRYGEVGKARLHLLGKVAAVTLHHPNHVRYHFSNPESASSFPFDVRRNGASDTVAVGRLDHPDDQIDQATHCLQVERQMHGMTDWENNWSGLLMRKVDEGDEYLRVGIYILCEDFLDLFEDEELEIQLCVLR